MLTNDHPLIQNYKPKYMVEAKLVTDLFTYSWWHTQPNAFCRLHWYPSGQQWISRNVESSIWRGIKHDQKTFIIRVPGGFVLKKFSKYCARRIGYRHFNI